MRVLRHSRCQPLLLPIPVPRYQNPVEIGLASSFLVHSACLLLTASRVATPTIQCHPPAAQGHGPRKHSLAPSPQAPTFPHARLGNNQNNKPNTAIAEGQHQKWVVIVQSPAVRGNNWLEDAPMYVNATKLVQRHDDVGAASSACRLASPKLSDLTARDLRGTRHFWVTRDAVYVLLTWASAFLFLLFLALVILLALSVLLFTFISICCAWATAPTSQG